MIMINDGYNFYSACAVEMWNELPAVIKLRKSEQYNTSL